MKFQIKVCDLFDGTFTIGGNYEDKWPKSLQIEKKAGI